MLYLSPYMPSKKHYGFCLGHMINVGQGDFNKAWKKGNISTNYTRKKNPPMDPLSSLPFVDSQPPCTLAFWWLLYYLLCFGFTTFKHNTTTKPINLNLNHQLVRPFPRALSQEYLQINSHTHTHTHTHTHIYLCVCVCIMVSLQINSYLQM